MLKTKVTESHDYLRLRLVDKNKDIINMTWSYRGDTVSGKTQDGLLKKAMYKWHYYRDSVTAQTKTTLLDAIQALEKKALQYDTIPDFIINW